MKFLIIEDDLSAAYLFRDLIKRSFKDPEITIVNTATDGLFQYLLQLHDILLVDNQLVGRERGIDMLRVLKKHSYCPTVLCVSGMPHLAQYEGKLFDLYTGKDLKKIEGFFKECKGYAPS